MLELLVGQAHQRFERHLVAEPVAPADVQHLCADEALDEREHVGVGAALHLRVQPPVAGIEERQLRDLRHAVGQERPAEVEVPAADHVAIRIPADAFGHFHALGITARIDGVLGNV